MTRKILSGGLIGVSSMLLILSMVGISSTWIFNRPLTRTSTARVQEVESKLAQSQTDIQYAKAEVERSLRIIASAEDVLAPLTGPTSGGETVLEDVNSLLNDKIIPGLQSTQENISQVYGTLEDLQAALEQANSLPFVDLNLPGDELLAGSLSVMEALNSEIITVQDLAQRASTFMSDTSYSLGGDFTETKHHLEELNLVLDDYDSSITDWRTQANRLIKSLPGWIDLASVILTFGLLWFGFSQCGLLLHGMDLWKGGHPLQVLSRKG
jgi:hypothetical protein